MRNNKSLGIYIHIPFCRRKCPYCHFYSRRFSKRDIDEYLKLLRIEVFKKASLFRSRFVDTIYFGGGTPSVLKEKDIFYIIKLIKENFNVLNHIEISMEMNPEDISKDYLLALKNVGINRITIGIQRLDEYGLKILKRNSLEINLRALHIANEVFKNYGIDIIYSIPYEKPEALMKGIIDGLSNFDIKHISIYEFVLEEGSKWKPYQFPETDEEMAVKLYEDISIILKGYGFFHYEVSNFSKGIKYASRHNLKYWTFCEYLAFGPSGHSFFHRKRCFNGRDLKEYRKLLSPRKFPCIFISTSKDELIKEYIMMGLRIWKGISIEDAVNTFGKEFYPFLKKIEKLVEEEILKLDGNRVFVPEDKWLVLNEILLKII